MVAIGVVGVMVVVWLVGFYWYGWGLWLRDWFFISTFIYQTQTISKQLPRHTHTHTVRRRPQRRGEHEGGSAHGHCVMWLGRYQKVQV